MDYKNKLKELREQKKALLVKSQNIKDELTFYTNTKNNKFIERYTAKKNINDMTLDNCNKTIDNLCKNIEKYSSFDVDTIGTILSQFVSTVEGEEYIYQSICYYPNVKYRNEDMVVNSEHVNLIVLKELAQPHWYDERYLNSLVKNGNAIVLFKGEYPHSKKYHIKFYQADIDTMHRINQCVSFGKLQYVKDFIDIVINYKIENQIENISFEQLEDLKTKVIYYNLDQIKEHHQELDDRKTNNFMQLLEHDKKVRNRQLQKILRNCQQQNIDK